jgi:dolichol-phosphate mannosyltransferase
VSATTATTTAQGRRAVVIVPTYNEVENIPRLVPEILAQDPTIDGLIVDDASPDGTAAAVRALHEFGSRVHMIERASKMGLGSAYIAGFRWALARDYGLVFEMDADFSHNPAHIPALISLADHFHVIIGSRYVPQGGLLNWGWFRRFLSWGANAFARMMLGLRVRDCTSA